MVFARVGAFEKNKFLLQIIYLFIGQRENRRVPRLCRGPANAEVKIIAISQDVRQRSRPLSVSGP
jgi:hypothetical protein